MDGFTIRTVILAKCLGHLFSGDGDTTPDLIARTAQARQTFNKMMWLWKSSILSTNLLLRLYVRGILAQM
eukprot:SAG11_NODE_563_length_8516_cov_11.669122_1_plen_69_part_10